MTDRWDEFYLAMAAMVSAKSKDVSTKCGCVLVGKDNAVISLGYNGLPSRVEDTKDRLNKRPDKYFFTEHAERNAVYLSKGDLNGATAYVTGPPCADCARALIIKGISRIVVPKKHNFRKRIYDPVWSDNCKASVEMITESGVVYDEIDVDVCDYLNKSVESVKHLYE